MLIVTFKRSLILSAVLLVAAFAGAAGNAVSGRFGPGSTTSSRSRVRLSERTRCRRRAPRVVNLAKSLVYWRNVAPERRRKRRTPNVGYNWAVPDAFVQAATSRGLEPVLTIFQAPNWASGRRVSQNGYDGVNRVSPSKFHAFAVALARHYKGNVHYYEALTSRTCPGSLHPSSRTASSSRRRNIAPSSTRSRRGIHSVDRSATVIGGNTAPFGHPKSASAEDLPEQGPLPEDEVRRVVDTPVHVRRARRTMRPTPKTSLSGTWASCARS